MWLIHNWIELTGVLVAFVYIFLEIRENIWLWPVGIVSALFFILIFYQSKFYADMGLQFYYLGISVYGWIYWSRGGVQNASKLSIKRINKETLIVIVIVSLLLYFVIDFILTQFTDSTIPGWDSFTTALSIVATWMLARKLIEHWWFLIVINFVLMILYVYKELYPTAVLFLVYTVMAGIGYFNWRTKLFNQHNDEN